MSDFNSSELVSLVNKTLDNELSEDEFHILSEILRDNPEVQGIYLEMIDMHTSLDDISFSRILKSKTSGRKKKKKPVFSFRLIVAAAILTLSAVFLYKLNFVENSQTFGVIVDDSQDVHIKGLEFKNGQTIPNSLIEFEKGLLSLKFPAGAKLLIEGPASFEILSASLTQLNSGKIFAYVPPKAKGFTVNVDKYKVVDLGTSFAIEALDSHELHVFEGLVELFEENSKSLVLKEGKAVKFSEKFSTQKIKLNKEKFSKLKNFGFPVRIFNFEESLEGWTQTKVGEYFDRGDKKSSELTKGNIRFVQSNSTYLSNEKGFLAHALKAQKFTGRIIPMPFYARDKSTTVTVLSSPPFTLLQGGGDIEAFIHGGCGATEKLQGTLNQLGMKSTTNGFLGIALRRVSDNSYVASARRTARAREGFKRGWEKVQIPLAELNSILEKSQPGEKYVLDLVDSFHSEEAIWTWIALDTVTVPGKFEDKENK